jgi:midasin (ATPase involved in ribosome maturation)
LIADQGYLLLAGRCRRADDRVKIQEVIGLATKRKINVETIFSVQSPYFPSIVSDKFNESNLEQINKHMILTLSARQMIVQCAQAFEANEPVLFVGETGCGKTSVAYLLAQVIECALDFNNVRIFRTVLNPSIAMNALILRTFWAKSGQLPTAYSNGKTVSLSAQ